MAECSHAPSSNNAAVLSVHRSRRHPTLFSCYRLQLLKPWITTDHLYVVKVQFENSSMREFCSLVDEVGARAFDVHFLVGMIEGWLWCWADACAHAGTLPMLSYVGICLVWRVCFLKLDDRLRWQDRHWYATVGGDTILSCGMHAFRETHFEAMQPTMHWRRLVRSVGRRQQCFSKCVSNPHVPNVVNLHELGARPVVFDWLRLVLILWNQTVVREHGFTCSLR